MVSIVLPLPEAAPHALPAVAEHVHVTLVSVAGTVSARWNGAVPVDGNGPRLVTVMVNLAVPPGTVLEPAATVLATTRSAQNDPLAIPVAGRRRLRGVDRAGESRPRAGGKAASQAGDATRDGAGCAERTAGCDRAAATTTARTVVGRRRPRLRHRPRTPSHR